MPDATPSPAPGDLFPFERSIALRGGETVTVREFTLRQRDEIAAVVDQLGDDEATKLIRQVIGASEEAGGEVELAVLDVVRAVLSKVKAGALTRLLAASIDLPENRKLWGDGDAYSWALDHVTIADEPLILAAVLEVNDVAAYLGKLWALLPTKATAKGGDEAEGGAA